MLGFLKNPHAFAVANALLTALLAYLYARTTERDEASQNKVFWKTLVLGIVAGLVLVWMVYGRQEPVATEPFNSDI